MTGAQELFESFIESDSNVHVELGMDTKHAVKGSETVSFRMESAGVLGVMGMLWVLELKSVLSISTIEKKGFDVLFRDGQALIKPVDHLFQLGVNVMYHEDMYLVVQHILKTYGSARKHFPPTRLSMYSECPLPCVG
jgi:hypothetical protein